MKLYYKPGTCSLASHIVLRELGEKFEIERVDTDTQKTETGEDFTQINPNGYVPALRLNNGEVLTEGASVLQYIADQHPESGLTPMAGTLARARLQEHLNFVSTELHKAFGPFFSSTSTIEEKKAATFNVEQKMNHVEALFSDGRKHLLGDEFSVSDAYLFVVSSWTKPTGIGLDKWPNIKAFSERVSKRKNVQEAMRAEGLIN